MTTLDTVAFLGGERVFGRPLASESDLAREIVRGFPSAALDTVLDNLQSDLISLTSIYQVVGEAQTLQRERQQHAQLSREESDRLARLARVAVHTTEALGSTEKGLRWLARSNPGPSMGGVRWICSPLKAEQVSSRTCWVGLNTE